MNALSSPPGSPIAAAFAPGPEEAPEGPVREIRNLLRHVVFKALAAAKETLAKEGLRPEIRYEAVEREICCLYSRRKVARAILSITAECRTATLVFSGCVDEEARTWMLESHVSFERMPPQCVSSLTRAEDIPRFVEFEMATFLGAFRAACRPHPTPPPASSSP